jgi:DNA-binding GntR family transcriptional regulator
VRDALARLALEGLVQRRARVGTTVAPLDLTEARDAYEARRLVEIHCAGLAATQASDAQIAAIRDTLADGEAAVEANDARALAAMDEAFHVAVATASGNRTLAKMVVTLHHQTARYWLHAMRAPSPGESLAALAEHRALADALAARDPVRARAVMEQLLGDFPEDMKRSLEA